MGTITLHAPDGVPEVRPGDDLATLLLDAVEVLDGDVVVVTSKVVSKAEGRIRRGERDTELATETVRVVASRGATTIVRNRLGLTMAAAGIDASNVEAGHVLLLPEDPDRSARALRQQIHVRTGRTVGVVLSDTAGRPWREGQTDIAIGAAGVVVAEDFTGRLDAHGNPLAVTAPAVADELASAAELASGKLGGRPFTLVRGRADLVLPAREDGPGAAALVREDGADLFGYGSREAVLRALLGRDEDRAPFGAPVPADELLDALEQLWPGAATGPDAGHAITVTVPDADVLVRIGVLAFSSGWQLFAPPAPAPDPPIRVRLCPGTP